jgi:hypothetical protein
VVVEKAVHTQTQGKCYVITVTRGGPDTALSRALTLFITETRVRGSAFLRNVWRAHGIDSSAVNPDSVPLVVAVSVPT